MKRLLNLSKFSKVHILWSHIFLIFYLGLLFSVFFLGTLNRFFVAEDFSWIRWAKDSSVNILFLNFVDSQGIFYRPVEKAIFYIEYSLFGLNPYPYYVVNLFLNFLVSVSVYILFFQVLRNKALAFLGAILFSFLPSHTQNLYWISTLSTTISSLFILFGLIFYYLAGIKKNILLSLLAVFFFSLSVFSYENAMIFIFLMVLVDMFILGKKSHKKKVMVYFSYILAIGVITLYLFLRHYSNAAGFLDEYDYNVLKAIQNSSGNYIGYSLMLFTGEHLVPVYRQVMESLKQYWILICVLGTFLVAFFGGFLLEHKEKIRITDDTKLFLFGFFFSILSLLPYLPLVGITLQYLYLASFGFILMILVVLRGVTLKWPYPIKILTYGVIGIIFVSFSYMYTREVLSQWSLASRITYQTFSYFKNLNTGKNMYAYIYDIPIKNGEAYIFPVGLVDMIYLSNENVTPYTTKDLESSLVYYNNDMNKNIESVILTFDKEYGLKEMHEK